MISSKKIQQRGYETLFAFTTANERSVFSRVVLAAPKRYQVQPLVLREALLQENHRSTLRRRK